MIEAADLAALRDGLGGSVVREHAPVEVEGRELSATLTPQGPEQLGEALRLLSGRGLAALVRGAGTELTLGNLPRRADVLLSTGGLGGIEQLDAEEGVARVGAATPVAELRSAARAEGWEPALDPPRPGATVGGVLACATLGARALGFGPPRDGVLGLDVVLGSGERTRCGGRVVKNVTGYDLAKLYTGSLGSLGVITSAWLRLRPAPAQVVSLTARVADWQEACELALEASRRPSARVATVIGRGPGAAEVWVELAGAEAVVESDGRWLAGRGLEAAADPAAERAAELQCDGTGPGALRLRVSSLPSRLSAVAGSLQRSGAALLVHAGCGLVHAIFEIGTAHAEDSGVDAQAVEAALCAGRDAADLGRGTLLLEAAPPAVKEGRDVFGEEPGRCPIHRELKRRFDPAGVLNPGRFAGRT